MGVSVLTFLRVRDNSAPVGLEAVIVRPLPAPWVMMPALGLWAVFTGDGLYQSDMGHLGVFPYSFSLMLGSSELTGT